MVDSNTVPSMTEFKTTRRGKLRVQSKGYNRHCEMQQKELRIVFRASSSYRSDGSKSKGGCVRSVPEPRRDDVNLPAVCDLPTGE